MLTCLEVLFIDLLVGEHKLHPRLTRAPYPPPYTLRAHRSTRPVAGESPGLTVCVSRRVQVPVTHSWDPGAALLPQRDAARHMEAMTKL